MLIKLRKLRGVVAGAPNDNIYEWQPEDSKRWYFIHRRKIMTGDHPSHDKYMLISQLFNALLVGLVCVVNGVYYRDTKVLEVEL